MAGRPGARLALGCALAVGGYFAQGWMLPNLRFVGMFLIATTLTPAGVLATVRDRRVQMLGAALMVGLSRKAMLGKLTGREPRERVPASVAAALLAVQNGAQIVRVHDVAATRDALAVWNAVKLRA